MFDRVLSTSLATASDSNVSNFIFITNFDLGAPEHRT